MTSRARRDHDEPPLLTIDAVALREAPSDTWRRASKRAPCRFTREQLGRLREIESRVECECPNHLSELLLSLGAFEDYAAACESRNSEDARIHALLHRSTAAARRIVEDSLVELLRHENIVL